MSAYVNMKVQEYRVITLLHASIKSWYVILFEFV